MKPLTSLIEGYRAFRRRYLSDEFQAYREVAAHRQEPKVMVICCSDSRVNPGIITQAGLGEIFEVANVANIVPPYRPSRHSHHSTSAALEFAVTVLKVEHIIVLGHSNCGGIAALLGGATQKHHEENYSFIAPWVDILADAAKKVEALPPHERQHACEREALKTSLANLKSFPWITERVTAGALHLHAWHFDVHTGELAAYDPARNSFAPLETASIEAA